jgi:hypothetical protein
MLNRNEIFFPLKLRNYFQNHLLLKYCKPQENLRKCYFALIFSNKYLKKRLYLHFENFEIKNGHNIYIIHDPYHDCEYLTHHYRYGTKP